MRLTELDAAFLRLADPAGSWTTRQKDMNGAQGVMFQCPKCSTGKEKTGDGAVVGAHYVICWFRGMGVPDDVKPRGRWNPEGTCLDDLTFVGPQACSVKINGGCEWHGHVAKGGAE